MFARLAAKVFFCRRRGAEAERKVSLWASEVLKLQTCGPLWYPWLQGYICDYGSPQTSVQSAEKTPCLCSYYHQSVWPHCSRLFWKWKAQGQQYFTLIWALRGLVLHQWRSEQKVVTANQLTWRKSCKNDDVARWSAGPSVNSNRRFRGKNSSYLRFKKRRETLHLHSNVFLNMFFHQRCFWKIGFSINEKGCKAMTTHSVQL